MRGWHFTDGWKLRDGSPLVVGKTYRHDGRLVMCESGLHASERIVDALSYAPGAVVSRVECGGDIVTDSNKLVCSERSVLWVIDATNVLHEFACRCAEDALALVATPDPRLVAAIAAKRAWLHDEIDDDELAAARAAARAAWDAAGDAAGDAVWDAAWAAAGAARAAAGDAARAATRDAARAATRDAAWTTQNRRLTSMIVSAHRKQEILAKQLSGAHILKKIGECTT